jgi:hypothetical protein
MSELDEWAAANLRYLQATCGSQLPWNDATSDNDTGEETGS